MTSIAESSTWPWEFDIYEWFPEVSPVDRRNQDVGLHTFGQSPPDFGPYFPTFTNAPTPDSASEMASELAQQLQLPVSSRLYLIALA